MKKIALAAAAVAFTASPAFAAGETDTTQGSATATIVAPITITHDIGAVLSFGTIIGGTAGTVIVNDDGTDGGGTATQTSDSVLSADSFTVDGDPGRAYDISTGGGNVSAGGTNIPFTTSPSAASGSLDGVTGQDSFTVGGTLSVAGTEAANTYTGSYDATVTYQ